MRSTRDPGLVLDTHVLVWLFTDSKRIRRPVREVIESMSHEGGVLVSAISFWEIAMLAAEDRLTFSRDLDAWIDHVVAHPALSIVPLAPEIALASNRLPGKIHGDPSDRIIVATARTLGAQLVTADRALLRYGKAGHVRAIAAA